jgi:hypothetical protein
LSIVVFQDIDNRKNPIGMREKGLTSDRFIWDDEKQKANIEKHGVTFNEASTVFDDDNALYFEDVSHSQDEDRFIILGYSERARMLFCYRNGDSLIRLISAREANKKERAQYRRQ